MDDTRRDDLRRRLVEVEERIERAGGRVAFGYGSESDRDGWMLWLRELTVRRDRLRAALGEDGAARPQD